MFVIMRIMCLFGNGALLTSLGPSKMLNLKRALAIGDETVIRYKNC